MTRSTTKQTTRGLARFACAALLAAAVGTAVAAEAIRIGYTPSWSSSANIAIAMKMTNICTKNGLECEITPFVAGGPQMEALLADKLDLALVADVPAVLFAARGGKGKYVARIQDYRNALIVRADAPFKALSDLRDKKIAAFVSSSAFAVMYVWMGAAGINPTTDLKVINLKPTEWVPALRKGEIDAFMAWDPIISSASDEKDLRILKEGLGLAPGVVVVSDKFAGNRDATVRAMMALKEAMLYMAMHKTQVNNWLSETNRFPVKAIDEASRADWNYVNAKTMKDVRTKLTQDDIQGLQQISDLLAKLGQIKEAPSISKHIDMAYLTEAEKRLASYDASTVKPK